MAEILNIQSPVAFDDSIVHYEVHAHQRYTTSNYSNSDEIRIAIQHQDLCLLPSRSSLRICGTLTPTNGEPLARTDLVNNAICHLFEDIRYELNAIEIDRCKNTGITSLMKAFLSLSPYQAMIMENAGWIGIGEEDSIQDTSGNFDISLPLSMIFGFAEDYRKIIINAKHELVLVRSRNDLNAVQQTAAVNPENVDVYEDFKITITKIEWWMPYVTVSDEYKLKLLKQLEKDRPISMSFRTWELYEYPLLPATSKHVWTVKTSNQLEKPRFVILALQTNRKGQKNTNSSRFDNCNLTNVKLFLNSQYYPYGNLNIDFAKYQYSVLYDMYTNFQRAYYNKEPEPILEKTAFGENAPLIVIDCSKQNESLKNAPVDVRLEFESKNNFPDNTAAYCLILHDRIVQYNPMSGDIKKL